MTERKPDEPESDPQGKHEGAAADSWRTEGDERWFKPLWRATSKADDGFIRVAKSLGAAARYVEAGVVRGVGTASRAPVAPECPGARPARAESDSGHAQGAEAAREPEPPQQQPEARSEPGRSCGARSGSGVPAMEKDAELWVRELLPDDAVRRLALRGVVDDWLRGSVEARRAALEAIAGLGPGAEALILAPLGHGTPEKIELVLEGLRRIGSTKLSGCMAQLLRTGDARVRIGTLRVAQQLGDPVARPLLVRGVEDRDWLVRRRTVQWLSWRSSPWAVERIWQLAADLNPAVKWAALDVLVWHDGPEVKQRVKRAKPHEAVFARRTAAMAALFGTRPDTTQPAPAQQRTGEAVAAPRSNPGMSRPPRKVKEAPEATGGPAEQEHEAGPERDGRD